MGANHYYVFPATCQLNGEPSNFKRVYCAVADREDLRNPGHQLVMAADYLPHLASTIVNNHLDYMSWLENEHAFRSGGLEMMFSWTAPCDWILSGTGQIYIPMGKLSEENIKTFSSFLKEEASSSRTFEELQKRIQHQRDSKVKKI